MLSKIERCAAQHFGPWCVEPHWFQQAVAAVRSGVWEAQPNDDDGDRPLFELDANGIARIQINGMLTKGLSSFGGTSTIRTRAAVRKAANDDGVKAILLHIDSPGGTVAGTRDLAQDIVIAGQQKPVFAHIDDLGASAALNVAVGASRVTANANAEVGSIGTIMVLHDSSGLAEKEGVKVHVLTTAPHKATGVRGVPISDEQLAAEQHIVDVLGQQFVDHVNATRRLDLKPGKGAADGRLFVGAEAVAEGLIDAVASFDQAMDMIIADLTRLDAEAANRPKLQRAKTARMGREVEMMRRKQG